MIVLPVVVLMDIMISLIKQSVDNVITLVQNVSHLLPIVQNVIILPDQPNLIATVNLVIMTIPLTILNV